MVLYMVMGYKEYAFGGPYMIGIYDNLQLAAQTAIAEEMVDGDVACDIQLMPVNKPTHTFDGQLKIDMASSMMRGDQTFKDLARERALKISGLEKNQTIFDNEAASHVDKLRDQLMALKKEK